jgi:hypothetical protein
VTKALKKFHGVGCDPETRAKIFEGFQTELYVFIGKGIDGPSRIVQGGVE